MSVIITVCILFSVFVTGEGTFASSYSEDKYSTKESSQTQPQTEAAISSDIADDNNPTSPVNPTESTEPTDPTEPTNPTEPTKTTEPTEPEKVIHYTGWAGTNLRYAFNSKTGTLIISGTGKAMRNYSAKNKAPWYDFADEIKVVNLKHVKNLLNIGNYAFYNLKNLKTFLYPDTVKKFGTFSMAGTKSLNSILMYKSVTMIYFKAFYNSGISAIKFHNKYTNLTDSPYTLPQKAVITCFGDKSHIYKYAKKYKRKVFLMVSEINLNSNKEVLCKNSKQTVKATITPGKASNKKLEWHSTNTKIATVNSKGEVKAKKQGVCYIYAKSTDNSGTSSKNKCKIVVTSFQLKQNIFTKNNCYKEHVAIDPKGIIVHSTGVNAPYLRTYVPAWNVAKPGGREVCVHGFVGMDSKGKMAAYQVLPFNMACWGCGRGSKGSFNYYPGYIQFECCEGNLYNKSYFNKVYDMATDYCAYLCLKYNLSYKQVTSHAEACKNGYASNHGDIDHWLKIYGLKISDLRNTVKEKIYAIDPHPDLVSGSKHKKITVAKNTYLRSKKYVDDYGNSSKKLILLKKGTQVSFYEDCDGGWSRVKYKGKKGYVLNSKINLSYKSNLFKEKIKSAGVKYYTKPSAKSKYTAGTFKKGTKVRVIGYITKGSKKGWSYIKYKGSNYYVRTEYFA